MNKQEKLNKLREIIIKAVPDIEARNTSGELLSGNTAFGGLINYRDNKIRLADVLLAILDKNPANRTNVVLEPSGQFILRGEDGNKYATENWKLNQDDLSLQDEPTLDFLLELLSKKVNI